jgi:hypothetical protein
MQRLVFSQSPQHHSLQWISSDDLKSWSDPVAISRFFVWSGLINIIGLVLVRFLVLPTLL